MDTKKDEVEEKRYSVLTNDDVDIQGVGLQSQLPETNVAANVTTSLEETEKEQQVEMLIRVWIPDDLTRQRDINGVSVYKKEQGLNFCYRRTLTK